ncbi:hypothetical protein RJT34_01967 [Clitoria ternatea]|uniref:Uncharacterized protein n=1 Tax=Clitoria ternatea TaxID=43366 RepID=A0AAN9KIL5_CLITE
MVRGYRKQKMAATSCRNCLMREVPRRLQIVGYNSVIYKTKWRSSLDIPSDDGNTAESVSADIKGTINSNYSRRGGMVLPFEPHSITFDDVTYSVDMPQEMRNQGVLQDKLQLLKGVSDAFRPGVLTALIGSTGAGNTTLMDGKIINN